MSSLPIITAPSRTIVPIIKVVGDFCNLKCRYCFYNQLDQSTPRVMEDALLEKFITEYMNMFQGPINFAWHGGEPLLAGLPFFQRVIELQHLNLHESHVIRNTIQTNGTLITDEWAKFFKSHDFGVGVSLDGAEESHNAFRLDRGRNTSFHNVLRGIEILRKHDVEPGIIQTITHTNVSHAQEDFHFLVESLKLKRLGLNFFIDPLHLNHSMRNEQVSNNEMSSFLKVYIDLWLAKDDFGFTIREIENFGFGILSKRTTSCIFNGTCSAFFTVNYDGKILPCDRLSNRPELTWGNLCQQSLIEILNGEKRLSFASAVNRTHPDCAKCDWYEACHNGCTMHRIGGLNGKYIYCEARKTIFAYLKEKYEQYSQAVA